MIKTNQWNRRFLIQLVETPQLVPDKNHEECAPNMALCCQSIVQKRQSGLCCFPPIVSDQIICLWEEVFYSVHFATFLQTKWINRNSTVMTFPDLFCFTPPPPPGVFLRPLVTNYMLWYSTLLCKKNSACAWGRKNISSLRWWWGGGGGAKQNRSTFSIVLF